MGLKLRLLAKDLSTKQLRVSELQATTFIDEYKISEECHFY